jgi:hypothetical protein
MRRVDPIVFGRELQLMRRRAWGLPEPLPPQAFPPSRSDSPGQAAINAALDRLEREVPQHCAEIRRKIAGRAAR